MSPEPTSTPPITFTLFVLSLAASAEIHLGLMPPPGADKPAEPNLTEASHLIELLAMLREKTRNNLDESEEQLLEGALYDLRLRYVEAAARQKRVVEP
ncbi:MAG: uncharacterized protein H6Q10_1191 [Acidobacteria bacterium]|nr:uncharacterized protein [Acidobacteriota bacterium]